MPSMDESRNVAAKDEAREGHRGGRLLGFARRRPLLSLGLLAGAGALGGLEWAAGALLGLGVAALVATPAGKKLRQDLRARARHLWQETEAHRPGDGQQPSAPA